MLAKRINPSARTSCVTKTKKQLLWFRTVHAGHMQEQDSYCPPNSESVAGLTVKRAQPAAKKATLC
jgi:hypothetical protein